MFWNSAKPKASQQALEGRILSAKHQPINDAFKSLSLGKASSTNDDKDKEEFVLDEKQPKTTVYKAPASVLDKRKASKMKGKDLFGAKDSKKLKTNDNALIEDKSSNLKDQTLMI